MDVPTLRMNGLNQFISVVMKNYFEQIFLTKPSFRKYLEKLLGVGMSSIVDKSMSRHFYFVN